MLGDPYIFLSFVSGIAVTTLGLVLCLVRIEPNEDSVKIRTARVILALSYFLLAVPDWLIITGASDAGDLTAATIVSASVQSLLFTFTLITMIQPRFITLKRLAVHVSLVSAGSIAYLALDSFIHSPYVTCVAAAAVIVQLVMYIMLFRQCYDRYVEQVSDYYDDERKQHLIWAKNSFYAALAVGICALVSLLLPERMYSGFMCAYIAFYIWFASRFINYVTKLNYYLPAVSAPLARSNGVQVANMSDSELPADFPDSSVEENDGEMKERLGRTLDEYVANKDYLDPERDRNWVIAASGTDPRFFRWYFQNVMAQDFRVWRANLRIEEAKRILRTTPDISMNALAIKLGFGTSQNFYHHFKKVVGMTPTEYLEKTR